MPLPYKEKPIDHEMKHEWNSSETKNNRAFYSNPIPLRALDGIAAFFVPVEAQHCWS